MEEGNLVRSKNFWRIQYHRLYIKNCFDFLSFSTRHSLFPSAHFFFFYPIDNRPFYIRDGACTSSVPRFFTLVIVDTMLRIGSSSAMRWSASSNAPTPWIASSSTSSSSTRVPTTSPKRTNDFPFRFRIFWPPLCRCWKVQKVNYLGKSTSNCFGILKISLQTCLFVSKLRAYIRPHTWLRDM